MLLADPQFCFIMALILGVSVVGYIAGRTVLYRCHWFLPLTAGLGYFACAVYFCVNRFGAVEEKHYHFAVGTLAIFVVTFLLLSVNKGKYDRKYKGQATQAS